MIKILFFHFLNIVELSAVTVHSAPHFAHRRVHMNKLWKLEFCSRAQSTPLGKR